MGTDTDSLIALPQWIQGPASLAPAMTGGHPVGTYCLTDRRTVREARGVYFKNNSAP